MALFKIFGNFASGNTTLPTSTTQGYCYFDKNTGKFYIDTATSDTAELGTNRLALNANKADDWNIINTIDVTTGDKDLNNYTTPGRYYVPRLFHQTGGNTLYPTGNFLLNAPMSADNGLVLAQYRGELQVYTNNSFILQIFITRVDTLGHFSIDARIFTESNWSAWADLTFTLPTTTEANRFLTYNPADGQYSFASIPSNDASDITYNSSTAPEDIQTQLEQDDETLSNVEQAINYIFGLFLDSNEILQFLDNHAYCFGENGLPQAELEADPVSDYEIATKHYVDQAFQANDAMIFKGTIGTGGTVTALPAEHYQGWTYKVITAGQYAGKQCEVGDMIICITDGTAENNGHWTIVQTNIDGAVTGPTSATTNAIATFNGTTGKIIQNSAKTLTTNAPASDSTDSTIPTSKAVWSAISNADTKVNVSTRGTTKAYLLADTTAPTSTATAHTAVAESDVYLDTTAGALAATTYKIAEAVTLQYNSTTQALDFIFA